MTAPCASLTVPMRVPVSPCAAATRGNTTHAAAHNSKRVRRDRVPDRLSQRDDAFTCSLLHEMGRGSAASWLRVAPDRLVRAKISLEPSRVSWDFQGFRRFFPAA